ncbi:hypothetical protein ACXYMO_02590 [Arenibacterium sp. CAU 1754]
MKRRDFVRLASSGMLGVAGLGLAGCEEYPTRTVYGVYLYYYYWDRNIYYHPYSQIYIYIINGRWVRTKRPPPYFVPNPAFRVRIINRDGMPYRNNLRHRQRYARSDVGSDTGPARIERSVDPAPRSTPPRSTSTPPRSTSTPPRSPSTPPRTTSTPPRTTSTPQRQTPGTRPPERRPSPSTAAQPSKQKQNEERIRRKRQEEEEERRRRLLDR